MREKPDIVAFVKLVRRLFIAFSVIALPAEMVFLVFAFMGYIGCIVGAAVLGVGYIAVYAAYAMQISMGTVLGVELTDKVIHVKTRRKIFTYDARRGCVAVKVKHSHFIATFQTQDSRDSFVFFRRLPLSRTKAEQFTIEEMRTICPAFDPHEE